MNPLYQSMQGQQQSGFLQQFNQFRQNFQGNPREQVQALLNSGRISQEQYNQAVQKANQLQRMLGIR